MLQPFRINSTYKICDILQNQYFKTINNIASVSPGPRVFITLKGCRSCIKLSPLQSFPQSGYTFGLWVNLHKPSLDAGGAVLYKFGSNNGEILCHLSNTSLIFEYSSKKKKESLDVYNN